MLTNEAAREFAVKHYNDIYSFCCSRLTNTEDASDVTQEVFLLFQEKLQTLENTNIRSWLFDVANKKIMSEYRTRMKSSNIIPYDDKLFDEHNEPLLDFDDYCYITDGAIAAAREKILSKLTTAERELFMQIYEKRKPYSEIATNLNISEKAVNVRAYRLRTKIKEMVEIAFMLLIFAFVKLK